MIYASITRGLWIFSHLENNFVLPQSANKNRTVGISSQNKANTSRPSVLYPLVTEDTPAPWWRIKTHNREHLPRMQCSPGRSEGGRQASSKTNTVHMGKWDSRRNRNTFYSREEEIWNNNNIVLYCGQAKPTYIQLSLTNSGTQSWHTTEKRSAFDNETTFPVALLTRPN